jgi:putative effector of murein hydrolase LrgA (UPF0299 family)
LSCNLGTLTSWNPLGLSSPVTGLLYLYLLLFAGKSQLNTLEQTKINAQKYLSIIEEKPD